MLGIDLSISSKRGSWSLSIPCATWQCSVNLEGNDHNLSTSVLNSLAVVNHVLKTYPFLKADLEYPLTAHPVETNMTLQD